MPYYKDLSKLSIEQYKEKLKSANLIPSWKILLENIDLWFKYLEKQKINNVEELAQVLKTKTKVQKFSEITGIPVDYLTILRREINSHKPSPRKLKDFTTIKDSTKQKLEEIGIKNTEQLYTNIITIESRNTLKIKTNLSDEEVIKIAKLTDLCRLRYVNHTFATVLIHTKFDTIENIQNANSQEVYEAVIEANKDNRFYKGKIGVKDMKFLVDDSQDLVIEIE